jgi:hypothetical protein
MFKTVLFFIGLLFCSGCGVYSLSGANIEGKTINIHTFQNRALNVAPSLATSLSNKVRSQILSQTGLAPVNSEDADYDLSCTITGYNVTISGMQSQTAASQNRLTITVEVDFKNKLENKSSFKQSFSRFADFPASQQLQSVQSKLIDQIGDQLAEDIFNKAFVNW